MVEIYGFMFEHLTAEPIGNPVRAYRVTTESGWYIRKPTFSELEYKTTTMLYATDDLANVEIVAEADLPEGAVINGVTPDTEVTE
jgi:hypothetical protein